MSGLQGSFATTMKRISEAMSLGQGSGLCLLVVFMVVVFVILWRLFSPVSNKHSICTPLSLNSISNEVS